MCVYINSRVKVEYARFQERKWDVGGKVESTHTWTANLEIIFETQESTVYMHLKITVVRGHSYDL